MITAAAVSISSAVLAASSVSRRVLLAWAGDRPRASSTWLGFHRTGGTGRARGSADPGFVQKQQQGFGLHAVKGNVHIAGQALGRITVQMGAGNGQ